MSEPLAGRIAFVTGGARGIGRAIALRLAAAGCDVAIAYHNSHEEAEAVVNAVRKMGWPRWHADLWRRVLPNERRTSCTLNSAAHSWPQL